MEILCPLLNISYCPPSEAVLSDRKILDGNNWINSHVRTFSTIDPSYALPNNIAVITLQELAIGKVLLRLAHLYEACLSAYKAKSGHSGYQLKSLLKKEDTNFKDLYGLPLSILKDKFKKLVCFLGCCITLLFMQISIVTEMSLSANQERGEMEKKKLVWEVEGPAEESKVFVNVNIGEDDLGWQGMGKGCNNRDKEGGCSWEGEMLWSLVFCGARDHQMSYSLGGLVEDFGKDTRRGVTWSTYMAVMGSGYVSTSKRLKDTRYRGLDEL
ncbi:hypothetical protein SO802_001722 [Lithocarpus litseifolius]|uniref:Uncharacterized protein n=1 Tax=Lithocarpus litseifolius TaxID=425828 RepID=A0AAW2DYR6_9ROSI